MQQNVMCRSSGKLGLAEVSLIVGSDDNTL